MCDIDLNHYGWFMCVNFLLNIFKMSKTSVDSFND